MADTQDFQEKFKELIENRRSIRKFSNITVPQDLINEIISAGIWAPTGTNQQELKFLIVTDEELRKKFSEFKKIKTAPLILMIFIDFEKYYEAFGNVKYLRHKRTLPFVDTGMAMMNMILTAEAQGLNTVALNVSDSLWFDNIKNRSIIQKFLRRIAVKLRISAFGIEFFHDFCQQKLKIDMNRYIPSGSIAVGYSDKALNIETLVYKGKPVKRTAVKDYLIQQNENKTT